MHWFKQRWEIQQNWQLLYPFIGILAVLYTAYKLALVCFKTHIIYTIISTIATSIALVYFVLWLFKRLKNKWQVTYRWQMIRIFIVFAITGSLSLVVSKPIFEILGFIKENFNSHSLLLILYYILKIILVLPFYIILLIFFGWLLNEFEFFYNFASKMLRRFGIKLK
ncbi:MAG: hypothetical protein HRT67_07495 [Flavobacteriaceae bacterium]|nr:hypothetical protein [Flavobacteriaceae bacterium]